MPHRNPADPTVGDRDALPSTLEFQLRRPTWRRGARVVLSDGKSWWLPPVDLSLILTCARFRRDVNTALRVVETFAGAPESGSVESIRCALYHAQMAQMGVTLLSENYRTPVGGWSCLTLFPRLDETLRFTGAVAEVLADALPAWSALLVDGRLPL